MIKNAIFITDIHFPFQHEKTIEICEQYIKGHKIDYLIFGGDNWDANGISKFTSKSEHSGLIDTYHQMLDFKKNIFDRLVKACKNPKLDVRLLLGNHDGQRLQDYFNKLIDRGEVDVYNYWNNQFNFKKLFNCPVIPYNQMTTIGKLNFIHGEKHNKYHTNAHLDIILDNVMYGHLHTKQIYSKTTKLTKPVQAISVPCASQLNPDYMKGRASSWINGFATIQFLNGYFWYQIIQIINSKTIIDGVLYE